MRKPQRVILARVAIVVASIVLGLLMGELVIRGAMPQALLVPWQDEINGIDVPRANVYGRHAIPHTFDVTFSIDSRRFRSRKDYRPEPAPGVIRIAVLGDSFTFGVGANDGETYPAQLERILQERLALDGSHRAVEVINAGVPGSGTAEQALYYDTWVKRFHPDVVLLAAFVFDVDRSLSRRIFSVEDGEAVLRPLEERLPPGHALRTVRLVLEKVPLFGLLAQHSEVFNLVRNAVSGFVERRVRPASMISQVHDKGQFEHEGLPLEAAEIKWLLARVRESSGRLAIVFVPPREIIYPSSAAWSDEVRRKSAATAGFLSKVCSQAGIPFVDITPEVRIRAQESRQPFYYTGLDTHPTPAGYRAFAEVISTFLLRTHVVHP